MTNEIWVFSEKPAFIPDLLAGAGLLAAERGMNVSAVILGGKEVVDLAFSHGVKTVYWLGEKDASHLVDDYVPTIAALVRQHQPYAVFVGATKRGKAAAARLAASFGTSVLPDIKQLTLDGDDLLATHMIFGGGAVREEKAQGSPVFITVGLGIFESKMVQPGLVGELVQVRFVEPTWKAVLKERKPRPPSSVNLAAAKKVVCPGRGIGKKEDLDMIFELAKLLDAEVGATRPLTEGLDWLPRERYIGVSGAFVKPDLYLGIGVSGQAQHTVGITESRIVVAINKDGDAPLFDQADYGIVGDLYEVVPALIRAMNARK